MVSAGCVRYCTENSFFSIKEIDIGVVADLGTLPRIQNLVNEGKVREWAYTGRKIHSKEALDSGLVTRVFKDETSMHKELLGLAKDIAGKSP